MRWLVLMLTLTGCTSVRYVPCPTIVAYSKADQAVLADEIRANPQPQIVRWIGDYIGMRDQARACQRK